MAFEKLSITLEVGEYEALSQLAERELRSIPQQARFHIREALIAAGLLTPGGAVTWSRSISSDR